MLPLERVVGAYLLPVDVWEGVVGERFGHAPLDEIGRRVHPGGAQVVDDRARLSVGRVPALLGMDSLEHMAHLADFGRWNVAEYIPVEMHHATLPASFGQVSLTGSFGKTESPCRALGCKLPMGEHRVAQQGAANLSAPHAHCRRAGAYLAGTNTRRVRRALAALFRGAVSKDIVSRVWRKIKSDWNSWSARSLAAEPIVRLILDGTVVRVRLDRKATSISLLVVIGVREDGQKVLLAVKNMGGESAEAWRSVLDDLISVACGGRPFSSMARRAWREQSPPSGMVCRCSGARFISTAICLRTRPNACLRKSAPTIPT